jgi:predicted ATPase
VGEKNTSSQRELQFTPENSPEQKLQKLERAFQLDTVPLLASLLSLSLPDRYPPLGLTPQKQKEKIQFALLTWLLQATERQPTLLVWEDLHWADPSTLEFLGLLLDQVPTTRLLLVLTFRPDFISSWATRSHFTSLILNRLNRKQVETMIAQVAADKALSTEVIQQVVTKTNGVPLFVEELTKTVLASIESIGSIESVGFAIPPTLHDALMARLDRMGSAKEIAQVGATLGREFSYELLRTVSPLDEESLQRSLARLVDAELLYQREVPNVTYLFKHALLQDAAYQSLLKSTRRQYHQQIASVLKERFSEIAETQPELLAHHYTEAGLIEHAIPYWQQAGQRSTQRSAFVEAIAHFTKGLELLKTLPDTPERAQREIMMQIALGGPLIATKGYAAPEVGLTYTRARELCQQVGETPQIFPVLRGLWAFYNVRAEYKTARELGEQCLSLAQRQKDSALLVEAHYALGNTLTFLGEFTLAQDHLEQGIAVQNPQQHPFRTFLYGQDPRVGCLSYSAAILWSLGYSDQALKKIRKALALAYELSHPFSLAFALVTAAVLHQFRREPQAAREHAEACITLSTEQGFALVLAWGTILRGWAVAEQGQGEEGIPQLLQGLAAHRTTGTGSNRTYFLACLVEAYGKTGQTKEGLTTLADALAMADKIGERYYEAELYRLKGTLTLQSQASLGQVKTGQDKSEDANTRPLTPDPQAGAEACFLKAIEIARKQQAKSWELRATTSLARLWQQQGRMKEAHEMLAVVYNWFTEGLDTKDLQEAKALLESLRERNEP